VKNVKNLSQDSWSPGEIHDLYRPPGNRITKLWDRGLGILVG
jgi:hypothetical protein